MGSVYRSVYKPQMDVPTLLRLKLILPGEKRILPLTAILFPGTEGSQDWGGGGGKGEEEKLKVNGESDR